MNFAIAVKSLIIQGDKILILKRKKDNPHAAGEWDIPGGRLDPGENPFNGLKREVSEETSLDVEIINPVDIQHFIRDDGQSITMIIFKCIPKSIGSLEISEEHDEHRWVRVEEASDYCPWLKDSIVNI